MATVGHIAAAAVAAKTLQDADEKRLPLRALAVFSALSCAPDLDVIAFALGIPYSHPFGHRGASHSFVAAAICGIIAWWFWRGKHRPVRMGILVALVVASHGVLDAFTDGGLGIALFWPFTEARFFAPWQPIPVAPIGAGLISSRGLYVLLTELFYFAPVLAWALWPSRPQRTRAAPPVESEEPFPDAVTLPVDGVLDLHNFHPRDIAELVPDYIRECHSLGIVDVRIIHGKGKGVQRRRVHSILQGLPEVEHFGLAKDRSAWGATLATLKSNTDGS